jgi:hypothetical protein
MAIKSTKKDKTVKDVKDNTVKDKTVKDVKDVKDKDKTFQAKNYSKKNYFTKNYSNYATFIILVWKSSLSNDFHFASIATALILTLYEQYQRYKIDRRKCDRLGQLSDWPTAFLLPLLLLNHHSIFANNIALFLVLAFNLGNHINDAILLLLIPLVYLSPFVLLYLLILWFSLTTFKQSFTIVEASILSNFITFGFNNVKRIPFDFNSVKIIPFDFNNFKIIPFDFNSVKIIPFDFNNAKITFPLDIILLVFNIFIFTVLLIALLNRFYKFNSVANAILFLVFYSALIAFYDPITIIVSIVHLLVENSHLCIYWISILALFLSIIPLSFKSGYRLSKNTYRKLFHLLILIISVPGIYSNVTLSISLLI